MASVITVGGLASGLDTATIISKLVSIEQQPVDALKQRLSDTQDTRDAVGQVTKGVAALADAANALRDATTILVRKASSSNEGVVVATAGTGAQRGTVGITVTQLARGSVAGATVGLASADATVAASDGTFKFQVGGGAVQSVSVSATTTLQQLAEEINNLGAGVVASAVNLGTAADPDFRLQLSSTATGSSSTVTVVHDDTNLAVKTTQAGQNALFTVDGFSGTFQRESNTVADVLPGVTFQLQSLGTATVTVADDTNAITSNAQALATAFNNLVTFVNGQNTVTESSDKSTSTVGPLANETTVRRVIDQLHATLSEPYAGATGQYVNLSSIGFATQKDGTISFDASKFQTALAADPSGVAAVFGGNGAVAGIANDVQTLANSFTDVGGALTTDDTALGDQLSSLQDQIDQGQKTVDAYQASLQEQFTALETLVGTLKQQGDFLTSVFAPKSS
jgi:flagellar hook-associated protein 2